jgi:hypothetical protein
VPHVYLRRADIAGGELPSAVGGMFVRVVGFRGIAVRVRGTFVKIQKF